MTFLSDFHFIRPAWLLLLPVVVGVWWLVRSATDPLRGWRTKMDPTLLAALTTKHGQHDGDERGVRSSDWRGIGLLVAWLLAVIAIAGPTWRPEPSPFADDPVPVMLLLRANETMKLADLAPSRMERASLKITDFAEARKGQPLGLVAYSGSSHLVLPPTRDTDVVASMAAEISPEIMPRPGDDLAGALELAAQTLDQGGGSIVVVADTVASGSDTALASFREQSPLPVYILAVASPGSPELDALQQAASTLRAQVTVISPDSQDIDSLVRLTAKVPVAVAAAGEGVRWAEAGWWLTPILAAFVAAAFRRERISLPEESAS